MYKTKIIAKVIAKIQLFEINRFLDNKLSEVSDNPKKIIELLKFFEEQNKMSQQEKLQLLNEAKKKKLIKYEKPRVDEAWRSVYKEWGLSHVKFWD